ncbi:DUF6789 family protein [bacterium]
MTKYIIISTISGILFGVMDGIINGNPFAQKLFQVYKPISKTSINIPAGLIIDLFYGFITAGIFLLLYQSLPGSTGVLKGISFALIIWFFRVLMYAITQWMTIKVPVITLFYILITGLIEMVLLGILYGATLKP